MSKILGLDIGTNSIGWGLIDDVKNQILGTGVRVFEEGLNRKGIAEESKNATRRQARQARRMNSRYKARRNKLIYYLREIGMYPDTTEGMTDYYSNDPYKLRTIGLDQALSLWELGRVLLHINQRRGYKSNRKTDKKTEKGIIYEGKDGKTGIDETSRAIKEGRFRTLGEYLYSLDTNKVRRRNRYTLRSMYIDEFNQLVDAQKQYHNWLTPDIKHDLYSIIFHQRPLKSQKRSIRKCTFEPKKRVSPKSSPLFQKFRILEQCVRIRIDDIDRINDRLTPEEFDILTNELNVKEKLTIKQVNKLLGLSSEAIINLQSQDNLKGNSTNYRLAKVFGSKRWYGFDEQTQYDIWNELHFYNDPPDRPNWLEDHFRKKWMLDDDQIDVLVKTRLERDYCNLSAKAMRVIVPYLEQRYTYDQAVILGGVHKILKRNTVLEQDIIDRIIDLYSRDEDSVVAIREYLHTSLRLDQSELDGLYHHSKIRVESGNCQYLPLPDDLHNPIVMKALFEVRKVINSLIEKYGKPDIIRVELARDTKNPKWKRIGIQKLNRQREQYYTGIRERLIGDNILNDPRYDDVNKYALWEECNHTCPYTGKRISLSALFSNEIQIEHIIPYSRSLNDSQANKTLCFSFENQKKHNRTPWEAYSSDEQRYGEILERVKKFQPISRIVKLGPDNAMIKSGYNNKWKLFQQKELNSDFISRQLVDTAYISRELAGFLSYVCSDVQVMPGRVTAILRRYWGLNTILSTDLEIKNREDHRHHAVDALVIVNTTRGFVQQLSRYHGTERLPESDRFPEPWPGYRTEAETAVNNILVSHAINHRARGKLHEETNYGRISILNENGEQKTTFVVKKELGSLTAKQVRSIVDKATRQAVYRRLEEYGIDVSGKFNIPRDAFLEPLYTLNGKVQIKRVRIAVPTKEMIQLYPGKNLFVEYGRNHHMEIFENSVQERIVKVVSMFDAIQRMKKRQPVVSTLSPKDEFTFKMSLAINDLILVDTDKTDLEGKILENQALGTQLYRIQKMDRNKIITLRHHTCSITNDSIGILHKTGNSIVGLKVKVNHIGHIIIDE